MSPLLSLYLDLIRFFAAILVLFDHLGVRPFTQDLVWWRLSAYGAPAVVVFFVLSGYVIAYVTATKENTPSLYFRARISRIYSVVIPALLLTWILDLFGSQLNPEFYEIEKIWFKHPSFEGYLASLFLVNEYAFLGFNGVSPGSNSPYWSLSFEFTYYLLFGIIFYFQSWVRYAVGICLLFAAGWTIFAMMPLWLLGVLAYKIRPLNISKSVLWCAAVFSMVLIAVGVDLSVMSVIPSSANLDLMWGAKPFRREVFYDYYVGILFFVHLTSVKSLLVDVKFDGLRFSGVVRYLGSLTFPLYLLHYPVIAFWSALNIFLIDDSGRLWLGLVFVFSVSVLGVWISEILRKIISKKLIPS